MVATEVGFVSQKAFVLNATRAVVIPMTDNKPLIRSVHWIGPQLKGHTTDIKNECPIVEDIMEYFNTALDYLGPNGGAFLATLGENRLH